MIYLAVEMAETAIYFNVFYMYAYVSVSYDDFGQLARIFWANGSPPPVAKNCPYAYGLKELYLLVIPVYTVQCDVCEQTSVSQSSSKWSDQWS